MTMASGANARGGKYLTFNLGREGYGIPIGKVRSIIGYMDVNSVPRTPAHVISVIDLRSKLAMESADQTDETCIIVVETRRGSRVIQTGLIVDKVSEVPHIPEDSIEDAPAFGSMVDTQFILGMAKLSNAVKILLDIDRIIGAEDEVPGQLAEAA
jgi:purine-binding chemotaxis protein CheW